MARWFDRKNMVPVALAFVAGGMIQAGIAWGSDATKPPVVFDEISVKRLNIVEPNGKFRLVLSNSERFPGLFMEGKEYKHHSRTGGGMLFFNDEGDEVGGMGFGSRKGPDGKASANGHIFFDQYKQDQTVGLLYSENDRKRTAGVRVWDRPNWSIGPLMEMSDRAAKAPTDAEKAKIRAEMMEYAKAQGDLGGERMFAGKLLDDAIVRLADKQGRPRLVMKVGADGAPTIEFLDETGKVVKKITQ
jgi:hypothetical protein